MSWDIKAAKENSKPCGKCGSRENVTRIVCRKICGKKSIYRSICYNCLNESFGVAELEDDGKVKFKKYDI